VLIILQSIRFVHFELFLVLYKYDRLLKNEFIRRLIMIREKQTEIWEQQLQLEIRVYSQFLPVEYDHLQDFIQSDMTVVTNARHKLIQINNQRLKIVQDTKRQWLGISLSIYEANLLTYEQQYKEILMELQSLLLRNTSLQGQTLFNHINEYMANRTKEFKQSVIRKIPGIRGRLLRNYQNLSPSATNTMIGVSPEPYLDLISNPFDRLEWHYLSLGISILFP
jgi:hypothetical protein